MSALDPSDRIYDRLNRAIAPTRKESPMLSALTIFLSSGAALTPQVIALIAAIRAQDGLSDEQILAHAKSIGDANTQAIVAERLRLLAEIAAQGGAE